MLTHRRRCPFCREKVHPEAVVCPHCQRELDPLKETSPSPWLWILTGLAGLGLGAALAIGFGFLRERRRWLEDRTIRLVRPKE
ncbi:hypothetical protein G4V39_07255 [Thermosulfuriphilus ammonigenes]|uniref:Uncharacterized protein n=1 Tax=Thermosulfuriphilus ammonigenes TaxID=1936021 RepID=A0A6G7PWZ6_9BACT|nr:hypothetical protein [Thermosulfuriphilus ammonigenes]MBA2847719.1 hypothetical protein [Thermosulfuriphilus ammonigenes]QIJ72076.1 hypothetical protein G4V39_07255 [Thermosulfuriphilus ammonigenes]